MTRSPDRAEEQERPDAAENSPSAKEPPESIPRQMWITIIMFAAFVVFTSGCMLNLLLR